VSARRLLSCDSFLRSRMGNQGTRLAMTNISIQRPLDTVPTDAALNALSLVLASEIFARSNRLSQFLRFVVERTLNGHEGSLKEYTIGTEAYGRKADFDPGQDTIVRTEARRLRSKLKEYYETEGKFDNVVIFMRSGSYVPAIRWRASLAGESQAPTRTADELWVEGDGVWVALAPFQTHANDSIASACALGITDDLLHRLVQVPGIRVVSTTVSRTYPQDSDSLKENGELEAQIILDGTVRIEHNRLRVSARVSTARGLLLWSQRFDAATDEDSLLKLHDAVAAALLSRIAPRASIVRRYLGTPTQTLYQFYSKALAAEALLEEGTVVTISDSLKRFEELVLEAPEYGRLHCGVAQCYMALAQRGAASSKEFVSKAGEACKRAIVIDSDAIDAHSTLGCILAQEWKWKPAEESFRKALRLGDQHAAHRQFAQFLLIHSRFDESWVHFQIAEAMDPFSARQKSSIARFFYYSRWHEEAKEYYARVKQYGPLPIEATLIRALIEIQMGELKSAVALAQGVRRKVGTVQLYLATIAEIFALSNEMDQARALTVSTGLLAEQASLSCFRKACLALALNKPADSIDFLSESFKRKESELPWIAADPRFDGIRNDVTYQSIVRAVL
jgi:TolB-like protein/Tfp pilus assembly protein PilF